MPKIIPHLWYDKEAREAADFYMSLFDQSQLLSSAVIPGTPSGDTEIINFELAGQQFSAISAGPYFRFNPTVSFMVTCRTAEEVDRKWQALVEGGTELMPLGAYPFSGRYAWIQDRYGLSWQLMLAGSEQAGSKITPNLLFSNGVCGKAEEAVRYYVEIFPDSEIGFISKYSEGEASSPKAQVNYSSFELCGMPFSAMDNGFDVDFSFNEAFSFIVNCDNQREIDDYWARLSAVPEAEQCGWLKDKYGLSWQIVPSNMGEIMSGGSEDEIRRVTEAFLKMKKLDIAALERARQGGV